ncbi:hypothetical protein N9A28_05460 [Sulfurimonas sp.]|nr:hypothetical protein [Sulfurimonas sp.]
MLDFMDEDWFIIGLEIVFMLFIAYDFKKYKETKKKEYITNIVLTLAFAVWTLLPFYNSYYGWNESQKQEYISTCNNENNESLCACLSQTVFKASFNDEFTAMDKNSTEFKEFIKESKEDCTDDSWF